jgi:hypothetical protein
MASKQRQLQRWSSLRQPVISKLICYICDYEGDISTYKIRKANDIFQAGELIRYQCPTCETIFGDLRFLSLTRDEINKDYEDVYSYYNEGDTSSYILHVLNDIDVCKDKTKTYLDYACGKWNTVIPTLRDKGYDIIGYDKFVSGNSYTTNQLPLTQYDIVYNCNYIEHVIEPYKDLGEIVSLVKSGGHVLFITACFEYCIEFTHYHTFFFNDKSLEHLANKLGLIPIFSKKYTFVNGEFTIAKLFKKR